MKVKEAGNNHTNGTTKTKTKTKISEETHPQGITLPVINLEEEVEQAWLKLGYGLSFLVAAPWLLWLHYFVGGTV